MKTILIELNEEQALAVVQALDYVTSQIAERLVWSFDGTTKRHRAIQAMDAINVQLGRK